MGFVTIIGPVGKRQIRLEGKERNGGSVSRIIIGREGTVKSIGSVLCVGGR